LANFLSISPNQTKFFAVCWPLPAGLFCRNTGSVSTHGVPAGGGMGPHLNLNDIGRNCLLGNRKKIAKFLMKTFTCRSTFLYAFNEPANSFYQTARVLLSRVSYIWSHIFSENLVNFLFTRKNGIAYRFIFQVYLIVNIFSGLCADII
jgi:hypothetical protein